MKNPWSILVFLLSGFSVTLNAQTTPPTAECFDVVYLRDGSNYRGRILETHPDGGITFETWSNQVMNFLPKQVTKVKQNCPCSQPIYENPAQKWYNASRLGVMPGSSQLSSSYRNDNVLGVSLLHTTGYQFSRWVGAGLGIGFEDYGGNTPFSYPIFAEFRSYLSAPRRISPYAAVSGGWAATNKTVNNSSNDMWRGGLLGKFELGLVCGNHFTVHSGLSFQALERQWTNDWNQNSGIDQYLFQRLVFGLGLRW